MDRYKIGSGTLSLIMERYHAGGIPIEELQMMPPKEVELLFYPQKNIKKKDIPLPDFQYYYDRIHAPNSRVNISYCWLDYKEHIVSQENIPGYKEIAENIYENSEVYPVAYVTSQYLLEEDYNTLEFPYNQTAFLDFAVVKNRSSCAGWKEQLQSKIQEVDIGFQYKEIDSRQYCLLDRMEHSYIKIRGEIRVISVPLLYHAYVYLEFLILACTIYILAPVNDKRVLRICRKKKIQSFIKHRYNCCTKPASDPAYVAENILNREFKSDMINQKWVTDVSEFKYGVGEDDKKGKLYLSVILDLCDRRPVAFVYSTRNDNPLVFDTFDKAVAANPGATPLLHSDRGYQYTSKAFRRRILAAGMTQSMSRVARCIDNGPMEGFWGLMKREMYYGKKYKTKEELMLAIEKYIDYYTNKRVQRNLGVLTPLEFHEQKFDSSGK